MEHYEMLGDHFAGTGNSYQHYAKASEAMKAAGQDAVVEDFLSANLWGTPDMILAKLRKRRELIGDFEVNGAFSYQSIPYDQVEQCMKLFAKEVGPEIKSWKPSPQPRRTAVDVNASATVRAGK
jgi:hypothetical protein